MTDPSNKVLRPGTHTVPFSLETPLAETASCYDGALRNFKMF